MLYEMLWEILSGRLQPTIPLRPLNGLSKTRKSCSPICIFTTAVKQVARARALLFMCRAKDKARLNWEADW